MEGINNIPKAGGFILTSNHVSYIDPVVLGCACNRSLNYMARDTLFKTPLLGAWMRAVRCIPVKRKSADLSALKEAIRRVNNGEGIGLFPEGTRSQEGKLSDNVEAGVGFLAAKLSVPVIPAFIAGSEKALPRGTNFLRPTEIKVIFGKPAVFDKKMPYEEIARSILGDIRHLAVKNSK